MSADAKLLPPGVPGDRMKPLEDWLERNGAHLMWTRARSTLTPLVECWLVKQVPVIVCKYRDGRGWELFVPSSPHTNRVDTSLDQAAILIGNGCEGGRGLVEHLPPSAGRADPDHQPPEAGQ